jgi:hypothetical protein
VGKRGPKALAVDWDKLDKMAFIQCTQEEIASVLNTSVKALERACERDHKVKFADYVAKKADGGKMSLRRQMWRKIEDGNVTMLIWASKNLLGWSDKNEISTGENKPFVLNYKLD